MKKSLLLISSFLIFSISFAQQKTVVFEKNRLVQVRKFSYSINPNILKQVSIPITTYDTIKTVTKEYAVILEENERFKKDSIVAKQNGKPWKREDQFSKVKYWKLNPKPVKYDLKFEKKDVENIVGFEKSEEFNYLNLSG
ncbi:hypothetical protein ABF176_002597, partial [Flavobacterium psychrophilum]